jgi:hypothetical protein
MGPLWVPFMGPLLVSPAPIYFYMLSKLIPYIFALLLFFAPRHAPAQIVVLPVQDLLMQIPDFNNAPNFDFWNGMNGNMPITNSSRQGRAKNETELLDLAWSIFPQAESIKIWRGNLIIKLKD